MRTREPENVVDDMMENLQNPIAINEAISTMQLLSEKNIPALTRHLDNGNRKKDFNFIGFLCSQSFDIDKHLFSTGNHGRSVAFLDRAFTKDERVQHELIRYNIKNDPIKDIVIQTLIYFAMAGAIERNYMDSPDVAEVTEWIISHIDPDKIPYVLKDYMNTLNPITQGKALHGYLDELMPFVVEIISTTQSKVELMEGIAPSIEAFVNDNSISLAMRNTMQKTADYTFQFMHHIAVNDFVNLVAHIELYTSSPTKENADACKKFSAKLAEKYPYFDDIKKLCQCLSSLKPPAPEKVIGISIYDKEGNSSKSSGLLTPPESPKPKG